MAVDAYGEMEYAEGICHPETTNLCMTNLGTSTLQLHTATVAGTGQNCKIAYSIWCKNLLGHKWDVILQ